MEDLELDGQVYHDDRMFLMYCCPCTVEAYDDLLFTTIYHDMAPENHVWAVVTYRNVAGYPASGAMTKHFGSETGAKEYIIKFDPTTPRVSLRGSSPDPTPTWEEYVSWKRENGYKDYDYTMLFDDGADRFQEQILCRNPQSREYTNLENVDRLIACFSSCKGRCERPFFDKHLHGVIYQENGYQLIKCEIEKDGKPLMGLNVKRFDNGEIQLLNLFGADRNIEQVLLQMALAASFVHRNKKYEDYFSQLQTLANATEWGHVFDLATEVTSEFPVRGYGWYWAGQACRFQDNYKKAIEFLSEAATLEPKNMNFIMALGIAYQKDLQWDKAIDLFQRAISFDDGYINAYNSLGYTYKKMGEYERAKESFRYALRKMSGEIASNLENTYGSPVVTTNQIFSKLSFDIAMEGAMFLAVNAEVDSLLMPDAEMAEQEDREETHGGLYWKDIELENGGIGRLFMPNFFNTVSLKLSRHTDYPNLISNLADVYEYLGEAEEAAEFRAEEAKLFGP